MAIAIRKRNSGQSFLVKNCSTSYDQLKRYDCHSIAEYRMLQFDASQVISKVRYTNPKVCSFLFLCFGKLNSVVRNIILIFLSEEHF